MFSPHGVSTVYLYNGIALKLQEKGNCKSDYGNGQRIHL